MMKYSNLFAEGQIGTLKIRNRIVMAPMGTLLGLADGHVSDHQTPPHGRIKQWRDAFPQARVVGDAVEARRVAEAVRESFDVAWALE